MAETIDDTESFEIQVSLPSGTARLQKLCIIYQGRIQYSDKQDYAAHHFDMIDTERYYPNHVQTTKNLAANTYGNPNFKVIAYLNAMMARPQYPYNSYDVFDFSYITTHEDWFIHDKWGTGTTNRIVTRGSCGGAEELTVQHIGSGYSDYVANNCCLAVTDLLSVYDGIFADNCEYNMSNWYATEFTSRYAGCSTYVPFSDFQADTQPFNTNWNTWMVAHTSNCRNTMDANGLSDKMFMGNCGMNTLLWNNMRAEFWEHFIHKRDDAYNTGWWDTNPTPIQQINLIRDHLATYPSHIIAVNSGAAWDTSHQPEIEDVARHVYACLCLAVPDVTKAYFSFQFMQSTTSTRPTRYPFMDNLSLISTTGSGATVCGQPLGAYALVSGTSTVYAREFENYYIVVNLAAYGSTPVSFIFHGQSYNSFPAKGYLFIPK